MDSNRWKQVDSLLQSVLERAPEERDAFLRHACATDEALEREVRSLLMAQQQAGAFLESPAIEVAARALAHEQSADEQETGDFPIGRTISHYRVIGKLGAGGMGVVYEAEDIRLKRRVALKFLPDNLAHDPRALQRFKREANAASSLNHPSICTIYEVEEQDGQPVIVMELLEGESLKERIRKGPVPADELLDLGIQTSDALAAAHAKGIIHRDIKPANIFMVGPDRVKILDFGLAKAIPKHRPEIEPSDNDQSLTVEGTIPGTTAYMSPEQVSGEEIDARGDLFSLGVVLYEAATGRRPFVGKNNVLTMNAILNEGPITPSRVNPELPPVFDAIIAKALEKDRTLRYQHASEIGADLRQLKRDTDSAQLPVSARTETSTRIKRRGMLATLAVAAALALSVGGYFYFHRTPKLTDKDTIVLADFANSTGDAIFDDTLKTALNVSLRQSPFLNVLPDSAVAKTLKLMTRPAGTKLTLDVAREVCQRAGSKAYIAGAIGSLGSKYMLELKAMNCQTGDSLAEEQVTAASEETVLDVLGEAASKLRGELGESLATVQRFDVLLAQATTSSLEALKAYSLGIKTGNEKGAVAALPYFERAIELDPNFAVGYSAVGNAYHNLGAPGRASEYISRAFQLREHASERERMGITAGYYRYVVGELDKAIQADQEQIENYPRTIPSYANLGIAFAEQGQFEKAVEMTRSGLRLAPDRVTWYINLACYTLAQQRFDHARQAIHEAQARNLDDSGIHDALYALAFLGSDSAAMAEQQQWYASQPEYETGGLGLASDTEAYDGHLGKARAQTKRTVDSAIRADNKEAGAIWQAIAAQREAAYGNATAALQTAAKALKLAPSSQGVESEAALAFALAGDTARAESLAQDLEKRFPLDTQMQSLWLPVIEAQLALDRKQPGSALTTLRAASNIELGLIPFLTNLSCLYPTYVRGEAHLADRQGSAAAAEFQKIIDHSGIVWNCWTGALAHLGVARANALQARTSHGADADAARVRALTAYKDFLTLWKDTDGDIPVLKQAKAEYAKLQ